jgi:hypothetical protein
MHSASRPQAQKFALRVLVRSHGEQIGQPAPYERPHRTMFARRSM